MIVFLFIGRSCILDLGFEFMYYGFIWLFRENEVRYNRVVCFSFFYVSFRLELYGGNLIGRCYN